MLESVLALELLLRCFCLCLSCLKFYALALFLDKREILASGVREAIEGMKPTRLGGG
jgi:hypothetical protein